jgi:hypothetical protein
MKTLSVLLFFLFISINAQEKYYTFSELKGMEDQSGNTHLFYRLYTFLEGEFPIGDYYQNSIYHFDLANNEDTLFLYDGRIYEDIINISDLEFWDSDPTKYIYCGAIISGDAGSFIRRFDQPNPTFDYLGEAYGIELGKQNNSLVVASAPYLIRSTDGGFSWENFIDADSLSYLKIVSISTFDDNVMFFSYTDGNLLRTTDGGTTINIIDTANYSLSYFFL